MWSRFHGYRSIERGRVGSGESSPGKLVENLRLVTAPKCKERSYQLGCEGGDALVIP